MRASKLRNAYKKHAIVYPNMLINIYDKQVTLIHRLHSPEKASKKCLVQQKEESSILQPSLLLTPTEIHRVSIHGYEAYGPENISL